MRFSKQAEPKSMTLTSPAWPFSNTFSGFKSQWMIWDVLSTHRASSICSTVLSINQQPITACVKVWLVCTHIIMLFMTSIAVPIEERQHGRGCVYALHQIGSQQDLQFCCRLWFSRYAMACTVLQGSLLARCEACV